MILRVLLAIVLVFGLVPRIAPAADSEIRCGVLGKNKSEKFELKDCMIARPRFDRRYQAAAGWELCVLTHGPLTRERPALLDALGKQVCVSGEHQGLGQFKADRLVPWELRYEPDPERQVFILGTLKIETAPPQGFRLKRVGDAVLAQKPGASDTRSPEQIQLKVVETAALSIPPDASEKRFGTRTVVYWKTTVTVGSGGTEHTTTVVEKQGQKALQYVHTHQSESSEPDLEPLWLLVGNTRPRPPKR